MAKKITINFNSQPTAGLGFRYAIKLNTINVVYPSGENEVNIEYQSFPYLDPTKVDIDIVYGLSRTIDNTLAFLVVYYSSPGITYSKVGDSIEVLAEMPDFTITVSVFETNPNISIVVTDVDTPNTIKLKYFFQYKNIVNHEYICEIYQKGYTGDLTEIHGTAILEKGSVTSLLEPIRGGGVTLKLEASKEFTLEDLYSQNEQDFSIKLYRNGNLIFRGYLHPDGVYQDYIRDEWIITLDCVDGLGALANLAYVETNGVPYLGKQKAIDIIYNCLKRTGIYMPINISINTYYEGLSDISQVFSNIYFNADRFVKTDNDTIMSCEEVLRSILDIFKACITQIDGEWYIFKPNEINTNAYVTFWNYNISNNYVKKNTLNLNRELGSQIDNYYPHHCTGNQKIEIKGAIGGFRLGYKYGLVSGLMPNPKLIKNGSALEYDDWTIDQSNNAIVNDPLKTYGFVFKNKTSYGFIHTAMSDLIPVAEGDVLSLKVSYETSSNSYNPTIVFEIKCGTNYLDSSPLEWNNSTSSRFLLQTDNKSGITTIPIPAIPESNNLTISVIDCLIFGGDGTTWIKSIDIIPTPNDQAIQGEFHTVERSDRVSTIVKENQTVFNGDNPSTIYLGAIFKFDGLTPTDLWFRKGIASAYKFPLLRIAAEEEMRISQKPTKAFIGDFYGYIPYLSLVSINNVGRFMFVEWSYDTMSNVTTCKQLELFANEIEDIQYAYTLDYGATVKPTIV